MAAKTSTMRLTAREQRVISLYRTLAAGDSDRDLTDRWLEKLQAGELARTEERTPAPKNARPRRMATTARELR